MADRIVVMDKDPGRVIAEMQAPLPHPRQRKSEEFQKLVDEVYGLLAGQTQPEHIELGSAPGEPGKTRGLLHITIGDLAGLLEYLGELPDNLTDIYLLPEDLGVDSDQVLRLIETAEMMGFATVNKGDVALTPLGETFAEATILVRKEIFATRIRRIPLVRWLLNLLQRSEKHTLPFEVVHTALELEFPLEEAGRQLDTLINWGRYAELFNFDDDRDEIFLEKTNAPAEDTS